MDRPHSTTAVATAANERHDVVKPSFALGAAALNFQVEANNLTGRINVLDFAGLFSGTAVAAPRSASARLRFTF